MCVPMEGSAGDGDSLRLSRALRPHHLPYFSPSHFEDSFPASELTLGGKRCCRGVENKDTSVTVP